jgi:hypothetical protein
MRNTTGAASPSFVLVAAAVAAGAVGASSPSLRQATIVRGGDEAVGDDDEAIALRFARA